tara:strand:+ start:570 stop:1256 length:687 start_codon:yes stop_codon:yes gene_type:complete
MYALVNGSFILLGPIGFNYRLINSTIKDDLNLDYNVGPLDYMNVPINFNDQLKILPVVNNIPHHNRKTEYANMIRWEVGEDRLTYFYEILPIPLEKLKQQYKEKITNERWHKENNGNITVTINDIEIKVATKRENRSQLASKISAMSADVRRRFKFQNTWIELNSAEMQTIIDEIDDYVQEQFDWEYTKHNEIDACGDCDALLSMPEFDVSYTNTGDSAAVDSSTTTG